MRLASRIGVLALLAAIAVAGYALVAGDDESAGDDDHAAMARVPASLFVAPAATARVPASLFVAPDGSDAGQCKRDRPCVSLARAYALAGSGDVVDVAGGRYPFQHLRNQPSRKGRNVVFREARGARVILQGLDIGSGSREEAASRVTLVGMETAYKSTEPGAGNQEGIFVGPGSSHIRLERMDAGSITAWQTDHLTVKGGDYGPCQATWPIDANVCGNFKLDASNNALIDGATLHDYQLDDSCFREEADCHWECMFVNGGVNNTIRNSEFRGCAYFDIFNTIFGSAVATGHKNLLIENNSFAAPYSPSASGGEANRGTAVWFSHCENSPEGLQRVSVRFNSFQANTQVGANRSPGCLWKDINVVGNLMLRGGCQPGWNYAYNVYTNLSWGGTCSPTDVVIGREFPYADGGGGTRMDYRIAGRAAERLRRVPVRLCPATDADRKPRARRGRCFAGAYERR